MTLYAGGIDQSLADAVMAAFPDAVITSAFRPGDSGFHGKGQAIDVGGGPLQAVANWAVQQDVAQVIWGPGPLKYNVGGTNITDQNQLRNQVYAGDLPGHYDHVHIAAEHPITAGGAPFGLPPDTMTGNPTGPVDAVDASAREQIGTVAEALKSVSKFLDMIRTGEGWARYLKVVAGAFLVLVGAWFVMQGVLFPNETPWKTVKDIATGGMWEQLSEVGTGDDDIEGIS